MVVSNMSCYCYIVECADGTYYTGWTTDPERRVATHNKGRGAKYTSMRLPVRLVYVEEQLDRKSAMKRELAIKRMKREGKAKLIKSKKYKRKQIHK
jgi:putative endonuclease